MPISRELVSLDEALSASREQVKEWHQGHMNPDFDLLLELVGFDEIYDRAEGVHVFVGDKAYLDFLSGYGALNLGHNHPEIIEAVQKVDGRPNMFQAALRPIATALAKNLAAITPGKLQRTFFCNSGAEAVEGALKLARAASGKHKIVFAENCFHGKTMGALSAGKKKYQMPFEPLVPGFERVPFGDTEALRNKLKEGGFAAYIVEPIQGEGGIVVPQVGYLKECEQVCREHETLLIVDEVQTGLGRTGAMFACDHEGVEPDIMCLAKALSGGIIPIGAFITTDEIWRKAYGGMERCLLHTSTFGGNARACAAGLATIEILCRDEGRIISETGTKGQRFLEKLKKLEHHSLVKEVRGKGLLAGIEFNQPQVLPGVVKHLLEENFASLVAADLKSEFKILTAYTFNNPNVIRLEPPLLVTDEQLSYAAESLDKVCGRGLTRSLVGEGLKAGRRLSGRIFKRIF